MRNGELEFGSFWFQRFLFDTIAIGMVEGFAMNNSFVTEKALGWPSIETILCNAATSAFL